MQFIAVDWGTTNFRAFLVNGRGDIVDKREVPMGLLQVRTGTFAEVFESILSPWLVDYQSMPVIMAGMVGSKQGWLEVKYVPTKAGIQEIAAGITSFTLPWGAKASLVPGVSHQSSTGIFDVMRGEEVQILGLAALVNANNFNAMLPGTHNKHALIQNGKITEFSTYLTGELFSVVSKHMLIATNLNFNSLGSNKSSFLQGVEVGNKADSLSQALFTVRTQRLFNVVTDDAAPDYLSGILIGNELRSLQADNYFIVGGSHLSQRYKEALGKLRISPAI
tara:strand:+ start:3195 stop:4028 length:834 start_codon:yes stop_codon:yes gene_type:complete